MTNTRMKEIPLAMATSASAAVACYCKGANAGRPSSGLLAGFQPRSSPMSSPIPSATANLGNESKGPWAARARPQEKLAG
jgi:hypothetical protein